MRLFQRKNRLLDRRGVTLVLAALLMITMLGFVAFAVDLGHECLSKTQLQTAADSAAMAAAADFNMGMAHATKTAQDYAAYHKVSGRQLTANSVQVEFGTWDAANRTFAANGVLSNAVRVTTARDSTHDGEIPMFFAPVFHKNSYSSSASAIAMTNPRDIAFVVDLSGSMNNDTEPCWATSEIDKAFGAQYPQIGEGLMQQVFTDFGYGTFPGTLQYIGQGSIASLTGTFVQYCYAELTKNTGYLANLPNPPSTNSVYKITSTDSEATRKTKAYKWIIDKQLAVLMPAAKPAPNSATNYNYWAAYLDYMIKSPKIASTSTYGKPRATYNVSIPDSQSSIQIYGSTLSNPYSDAYPNADNSVPQGYQNYVGYRTYVQFMMDFGREGKPDGAQYTPLSLSSGVTVCPTHLESTDGGDFWFPPSEQPTHASRRAIIAALKVISDRNQGVDPSQCDRVAIVSFDTTARVVQTLTSDYHGAMQACTTLQAVSDMTYSTASEAGLSLAQSLISPSGTGSVGRQFTNKVVVMLTDGLPNIHTGNPSTYISQNPSPNYFTSGSYKDDKNAALVQAAQMAAKKWMVFPVGIGLGCDYNFMDPMARMGGTAVGGQSPRGSGNPAQYEQRLRDIFTDIISNPKCRLVK
jgi:hypothetical protein